MSSVTESGFFRYGIGVMTVALATILTSTISTFHTRSPFALFFVAVLLSTIFGGRGVGFAATALSVIAITSYILPVPGTFIVQAEELLMVGVFVFISFVINSLTGKLARTRSDAQLSNAQLTATLMSVGDGMIATDEKGRLTLMNVVAESLTGWTQEEVRGKKFHDVVKFLNARTGEEAENILPNLFSDGEIPNWSDQGVLIAKGGRETQVEVNRTSVRNEKGNLTALVFVFRDVSGQKEADEKIRFQAHLLDVVEQAMIATDVDGTIIYWNQYATKIYGWNAEEVIGRNILDVTTGGATLGKATDIMSQLRQGESWSGDFIAQHRDGSSIPIRCVNSPVYDEDGKQIGIVGSSEDISARIRIDREKARLTLAIEEQRLRLDNIVASVPGVVWETWGEPDAASQRINFVSSYVESMLGYSVDEWLETPNFWLDIVHKDDKEQAAREASDIFTAGQGVSRFRWIARDGRVVPVEAHSVAILDDEGRPVGMRGVTMDVSERVRADEIRSRMAALVESSDDAIIGKTLEGIITSWNRGAERVYGYSAQEAVGKPISLIVPPDRSSELTEILEKLRNEQRVENLETVRVRKDGTKVNVSVTVSPIKNLYGQIIGASAIAHDITKRIRVEQAVRDSEERYRSVAETASDAIITIDEASTIQFVNRAAGVIFGYAADDLLGQKLTVLMPDYLRNAHRTGMERYVHTRAKHMSWTGVELPGLHKSGKEIPLELSFSEFVKDGKRFFTGIARDITERKLVEERQAELLKREQAARTHAELVNRTKDEFLATLSHELRTPLTAMLGWTWMLQNKPLDAETYKRAVETIDRNVNIQAQLIDDLLDVSRIITGKLRLDVRPVDLVPIIEAAIDTVRAAATAKGIELIIDLDLSDNPVECDPARMQQVAWNLLSNAVKFTPKRGTVHVQLRHFESYVELIVTDNGVGIVPEFIPYVFDRFRQADSSTTRTHGGLGLGLAVVRHLAELHGGTAAVESEGLGKGASFTITLPLFAVSHPIEERTTSTTI